MHAAIRGTRIYFDIEGSGLVADGPQMRERPAAFVIHGGPGGDHSGFKPGMGVLADRLQLVYFDHRGQGRSDRCDPTLYNLDENVKDMEALRLHLGLEQIVSIGTSYGGMVFCASQSGLILHEQNPWLPWWLGSPCRSRGCDPVRVGLRQQTLR